MKEKLNVGDIIRVEHHDHYNTVCFIKRIEGEKCELFILFDKTKCKEDMFKFGTIWNLNFKNLLNVRTTVLTSEKGIK